MKIKDLLERLETEKSQRPLIKNKSAKELLELDAPMYAIGGLAVGEPKNEMLETVELLNTIMP